MKRHSSEMQPHADKTDLVDRLRRRGRRQPVIQSPRSDENLDVLSTVAVDSPKERSMSPCEQPSSPFSLVAGKPIQREHEGITKSRLNASIRRARCLDPNLSIEDFENEVLLRAPREDYLMPPPDFGDSSSSISDDLNAEEEHLKERAFSQVVNPRQAFFSNDLDVRDCSEEEMFQQDDTSESFTQ